LFLAVVWHESDPPPLVLYCATCEGWKRDEAVPVA
jgi:hypothetical protein